MLACSRLLRTTACPHERAGTNVLDFPEGLRPKATVVSPWYGVNGCRLASTIPY